MSGRGWLNCWTNNVFCGIVNEANLINRPASWMLGGKSGHHEKIIGNANRVVSNDYSGTVPQRQYYPPALEQGDKGEKCLDVLINFRATKRAY